MQHFPAATPGAAVEKCPDQFVLGCSPSQPIRRDKLRTRATLDAAVLDAGGFGAKKDLLAQLLDLNVVVGTARPHAVLSGLISGFASFVRAKKSH